MERDQYKEIENTLNERHQKELSDGYKINVTKNDESHLVVSIVKTEVK